MVNFSERDRSLWKSLILNTDWIHLIENSQKAMMV
nr:MAG TPA: hypothetical protein [Caudoviricetes sp.]